MSGTNIEPLRPGMSLDTAPPADAPASEHEVERDAPAEGEGRPLTEREQMMESIVARRQAQFAAEVRRGDEIEDETRHATGLPALDDDPGAGEQQPDALREPAPVPPQRQAAAPVAQPEPQQRVAAQPVPQASQAPQPAQLIPVDIGNQRVNVTPAQLVELARRHLIATQQANQPRPAAPPPPPQPILTDDEARAFHRRIAFGDSETDGAQAIRDLVQSVMARAPAAPPAVDPVQVANLAREQTLAQIRHEQNLTALGTEYPDVFENTTLARLAALEYHNLRQEEAATGTYRPDLDAYREAANRVRSVLTRGQPQPQPGRQAEPQPVAQAASTPVDQSTRLERKRAAPRVPTGVSMVPAAEQPRRYPTSAEIVEKMRAERFQTPMR